MNLRFRGPPGTNDHPLRPSGLLSPNGRPGDSVRQVLNLNNHGPPTPETPPDGPLITDEGPTQLQPPTALPDNQLERQSALCRIAATHLIGSFAPDLSALLAWQREVGGDTTKQKAFQREALQQNDLTVFAFMRGHSPFIHLLHSASTFAALGGDVDYKGQDIGFIGDQSPSQSPLPVRLPPDTWKWIAKPASLDVLAMETYYAVPANANKLWQPPAAPKARNPKVPRLLFLPALFVEFCASQRRTPFQLLQYIVEYSNAANGAPIADCQLCLDWCLVASHPSDADTTTNSIMAMSFEAAISTDEIFNRWTRRRLTATLGSLDIQPAVATFEPPPTTAAPPLPTPDMWAQVAANLSQGMVNVAAAMHPHAPVTVTGGSTLEEGGKPYDPFQLAIIQGFSHSTTPATIPPIWALFTTTKHIDTHKDNLKKKMKLWAEAKHVQIDRGLLFLNSTIREILTLRFNPGNTTAVYSTAEQGLSLLICKTRSGDDKNTIRLRELAEEMSKNTRTLADAEKLTKFDPRPAPDNYNELLRCIGTYCALLHTLFGTRCQFFKHCFGVWTALDSDHVADRRQFFTPLFCRQISWAIIEDGRSYFSQRMTPDDFFVEDVDELVFPSSTLNEIVPFLRHQTPLVRSTFPPQWTTAASTARQTMNDTTHQPLPSVLATPHPTPTVISAITVPTAASSPTRSTQQQGAIRDTNVHPKIKELMGPYIQKFHAVMLNRLLGHAGLTIDDLPTLQGSEHKICYNYILGKCVHKGCLNKAGHIDVTKVSDEFAAALVEKLSPAVTEFLQNGPGAPKRRRT